VTLTEIDEIGCVFDQQRRRLLGIAYRMLGSISDAEDVVAEASARWLRVDHSTVRDPPALLTTIVTRIALDELKSARRNRETYIGPWLPEPVLTDPASDPLERTERRDDIRFAALHLLESLTPHERGVFVLREALDMPYDQIATILELTVANARQLMHRARQKMATAKQSVNADEHAIVVARFVDVVTSGDIQGLTELLAADVAAYSDGGGEIRAAPRPVVGRARVARFFGTILRRFPVDAATTVQANDLPALLLPMRGREAFVALDVRDGSIGTIFTVMNPTKLRYLDRQVVDRCPSPSAAMFGGVTPDEVNDDDVLDWFVRPSARRL
jgi:RNA polymerase sigma-70 factor (ECF subfamily)